MTSILFWLDRAYRKQIQCIEIFHVDIKWFIHPMWLLKFNVFWVFLYNRSPFICKHDRIAYWSLEIDLSELQEYDLVDAKKKKVKHVWIRLILLCFFSQTFQWPVARPIDKDEVVEIQLFNYNKYLSNR